MKLYCVRHAEAESVPEDKQRCLSAKGELDVKKIVENKIVNRITIFFTMFIILNLTFCTYGLIN